MVVQQQANKMTYSELTGQASGSIAGQSSGFDEDQSFSVTSGHLTACMTCGCPSKTRTGSSSSGSCGHFSIGRKRRRRRSACRCLLSTRTANAFGGAREAKSLLQRPGTAQPGPLSDDPFLMCRTSFLLRYTVPNNPVAAPIPVAQGRRSPQCWGRPY